MGRLLGTLLSLWVAGLISVAVGLIVVPALFYLTYLVLSAAMSFKGLVPLALATGWLVAWRQERNRN